MIYLSDIKPMKLSTRQFRLPVNPKNRKHGYAATLLTPNTKSTLKIINGSNRFIDVTNYESYYIEKDISYLITDRTITETSAEVPDSEKYCWDPVSESYLSEGVFKEKKIVFNGFAYDINLAKQVISIDSIEDINRKYFRENLNYPLSVTIYPTIASTVPKTTANDINVLSSSAFNSVINYQEKCFIEMVKCIIYTINPQTPPAIVNAYSKVILYEHKKKTFKENDVSKDLERSIQSFVHKPDGYSKMVKMIRTSNYTDLGNADIQNIINTYKPLFEEKMPESTRIKKNTTTELRKGSNHILDNIQDVSSIGAGIDVEKPDSQIPTQQVGNTIPVQSPDKVTSKDDEVKNESYDISILSEITSSNTYSTDMYLKIDESFITFFPSREDLLDEATSTNIANQKLKNMLYKERLRSSKQVFAKYNEIQEAAPNMKYMYLDYSRYKKKNLFIDLSFYNELYFKNSSYKKTLGIELYFYMVSRLIRMANDNNYKNTTLIIPVNDWDVNPETKMWFYTEQINPISLIYNLIKTKKENLLQELFNDMDIIFLGDNYYFRAKATDLCKKNLPTIERFIKIIRKNVIAPTDIQVDNEEQADKKDSTEIINDEILDKIEKTTEIKIHRFTGDEPKKATVQKTKEKKEENVLNTATESDDIKNTELQNKVAKKIADTANNSKSTEEALEKLDKDNEFKQILMQLETESPNGPAINASRSKRMEQLNSDFLKKSVNGSTVQDILNKQSSYGTKKIEEIGIPVDSINEEWKHLKYAGIAKYYDPNDDIIAGINSLSKMSYPISIRDISIENTSTSEDMIETYTVQCENHLGKRFSLVFDVPILIDGTYMRLRGNSKNIETQNTLNPILKTESDTAQMISNYKKIFFRIYGSSAGKSNVYADKLLKVLKKHKFKDIEISYGDNRIICKQYELPIDYIDISQVISKITVKDTTFFFNQYELRNNYQVDDSKGLPIGIRTKGTSYEVLYYADDDKNFFSKIIVDYLCDNVAGFREAFDNASRSVRYQYSKASIMSTEIPIIVIMGYHVGLTKAMEIANVEYKLVDKIPPRSKMEDGYDLIKFNDGAVIFKETYESSLLMNGLKECNTEDFSITEMDTRNMYLNFLDMFGGRIKADGLDNFYDCMIDPITESILQILKLPTDYIELLAYANNLLVDNKYSIHGNMNVRRLRRSELIAAYAINCLYMEYGNYANQLKHGRELTMSIKKSAVIDAIMKDNTVGDQSNINIFNDYEASHSVSPRGIVGMNSEHSYSEDKRAFDNSMINIVSLSTGFANTVGISRMATINANVDTYRGFAKEPKLEDMNPINTFSMVEAISTYMSTRDDPFRDAMTAGQTVKHLVRCNNMQPPLISSGADQAIAYLTPNTYSFKAKQDGKVRKKTEKYMILEYKDGTCDYVDLSQKSMKNSSTGFFISLHLVSELNEGSRFKAGEIVAVDDLSFKKSAGFSNNYSCSYSVLAKAALLFTDECFEDSAIVSEALSKSLSTDIVLERAVSLDKNTNVYNMIKVGENIKEGQTLLIIQQPYDDEEANNLIKKLSAGDDDASEVVSELGKIPIKSKVTGWIHDIEIYRTCEIDELSESLQKIVKAYENEIKKVRVELEKCGIDTKGILQSDYKLPATGKLKDTPDGVKIIFHMAYYDKFGVGDKMIYHNANKGVNKDIFPVGKEPYSIYSPDEKIHTFVNVNSNNARMITSIPHVGVSNRLCIEAGRRVKDMLHIKYDKNIIK